MKTEPTSPDSGNYGIGWYLRRASLVVLSNLSLENATFRETFNTECWNGTCFTTSAKELMFNQAFVCLSGCLPCHNYWSDLHENFTRNVSLDKEDLIKFWKLSGPPWRRSALSGSALLEMFRTVAHGCSIHTFTEWNTCLAYTCMYSRIFRVVTCTHVLLWFCLWGLRSWLHRDRFDPNNKCIVWSAPTFQNKAIIWADFTLGTAHDAFSTPSHVESSRLLCNSFKSGHFRTSAHCKTPSTLDSTALLPSLLTIYPNFIYLSLLSPLRCLLTQSRHQPHLQVSLLSSLQHASQRSNLTSQQTIWFWSNPNLVS